MKRSILTIYLLFLHCSLSALEVTVATFNALGEAAYLEKSGGVGISPEARRKLFAGVVQKHLTDVDIIALQEVQCRGRNAQGKILSLFEDESDFSSAVDLPLHETVRSQLNDELVTLFRKDLYELIASKDVPLFGSYGSFPLRHAQLTTLRSISVPEAYLIVANLHLKGGYQPSVADDTAAQLESVQYELADVIESSGISEKNLMVAVMGDFNIAHSCYNESTGMRNYDMVIAPFMQNVAGSMSVLMRFNGLYDAFCNMSISRPSSGKDLDGLDYLFYGANCSVKGSHSVAIPTADNMFYEAMTHTEFDKDRTFPSDHAILKVTLSADFSGGALEGKEGKENKKKSK